MVTRRACSSHEWRLPQALTAAGLSPAVFTSTFPITFLVGSLFRALASADLLLTRPHTLWRAVGSSNLAARENSSFACLAWKYQLDRCLQRGLRGRDPWRPAGLWSTGRGLGDPLCGRAPGAMHGCCSGQKSRCLPLLHHLLTCGSCQCSCWWGCAVKHTWELRCVLKTPSLSSFIANSTWDTSVT